MTKLRPHKQIVVSLTSFPAAILYAIDAIKSILDGCVLPDKIVLYLNPSEFGEKPLPKELLDFVKANPLVEIRIYDHNIRSYLKLVPALNDFPEAIIITIDDDQKYHRNLLKELLGVHRKYPEAIVAQRVRRIKLNTPYHKWKKYKWHNFLLKKYHPTYKNLQTGVGGVLYPPHSLKKEMIDEALFTKLAPTADDIWFWAAAVANEKKIIPVPFGISAPHGIGKPMDISLMSINYRSGDDRNVKSLNAILKAYPEIRNKIENE